jgi:RNA polymerase sigma factor (sigma-70 family)
MSPNAVPPVLHHVRRLAAAASSDEQLLADFLARRSDEAFSALVGRHGPMVLNVCRRILHDAHAAEDVFQATFLVLAERGGAVRRRASLAGFLHGVAYRLAVRARRHTSPKRERGEGLSLARASGLCGAVYDKAASPPDGLAWKEMLGILDDELGQLPDRYRAPLVLCYLEGRTQDEAARQLGWGLNTLRRRVAQGRRLLEARLRGRGVTLPAALAGLLAASAAAVPAPLRAATLAAAARSAVGPAAAAAGNGLSLLLSTSRKKVAAALALAVLGAVVCVGYGLTPPADHPRRRPIRPPRPRRPSRGAATPPPTRCRPGPPSASARPATATAPGSRASPCPPTASSRPPPAGTASGMSRRRPSRPRACST